ncbi:MAG: serine/threonine-protein kinase [Acidimicrobiales bacterium]
MRAPSLPGYRVDALLGRGATAEVWLAWTRASCPRPVALKMVRSDGPDATGLRRQAALVARCDHPNLLGVLEVVETEGSVAIVSPYVAGGTLADLLASTGTLRIGELVALLTPVAAAVTALHRAGVVHGDLKPANILLTADGTPMVADVLGPTHAAGTPMYLAPEAATSPATAAADMFALGVIAYEVLTGAPPHRGNSREVLAAATEGAHRPLSSWPAIPSIAAVAIEAALGAQPDGRPAPLALAGAIRSAVPAGEISLAVPDHAVMPLGVDRPATVSLGERPRVLEVGTAGQRHDRRAAAWVIASTVAVVAFATVAVLHRGDAPAAPHVSGTGARGPCASARPAAGATSNDNITRPLRPGVGRTVDLGGVGCATRVRWRDGVLVVGSGPHARRYAVGTAADQVLVGDWDGDAMAGIAVYEPGRGRVLSIDRLVERPGAIVRADRVEVARRRGRARIRRGADRRDEVLVEPRP